MSQTFVLDGPTRLANALKFLQALPLVKGDKPKLWKIVISEYRAQRSDEQNNALWGVAYPPIMDHMGLSGERGREEIHEYFCGEYFGWVRFKILDKQKMRPKRTTTTDENGQRDVLHKLDFAQFYDFIQRRAAENGIYVPDPDPFWREELRRLAA